MDSVLEKIINHNRAQYDADGILVSGYDFKDAISISKKAWERIYDFDILKLEEDRMVFDRDKLKDHRYYIDPSYPFTNETIFLELGCGPAHIGEYIMKYFGAYFIGVDFNYKMLLTLKRYLDKKGYKKYLLIHADINKIPIIENSVDFVYGGCVIGHLTDTEHALGECYRILKEGGISFNSFPSFNFWWLTRCYSNIPNLPILKILFEFIHITLLKNKILEKCYGYEQSYTKRRLRTIHQKTKFRDVSIRPFAFHSALGKLNSQFFRQCYFKLQKTSLFTALYLVIGRK